MADEALLKKRYDEAAYQVVNGHNNHCDLCGKAAEELSCPLSRCSQCKVVSYCSKDCQTKDWKIHKKECSRFKEMRSVIKAKQKHMSNRYGVSKRDIKSNNKESENMWEKTNGAAAFLARVVNFFGVDVSNQSGILQDQQLCHHVYSMQTLSVEIFPSSPFPEIQQSFIVIVTEIHEFEKKFVDKLESNKFSLFVQERLGDVLPQDGAIYVQDIYNGSASLACEEFAPLPQQRKGVPDISTWKNASEYLRLRNRLIAELMAPQMASYRAPRVDISDCSEEAWKRLSRDSRFRDTVRGKPFGVVCKSPKHTMFFVNIPVIQENFKWANTRILQEEEKQAQEGFSCSMVDLIRAVSQTLLNGGKLK